ncbi:MAG TPA: FtsX-like permease family protein, partial [Verrucomicrobiae bacterium]|nr:FtsX-like permease family protein [Verrucomicrobiae bacterium]
LAPAWQTARTALTTELNDSSRGSSGGFHRRKLRAVLVVGEMALSLVLLVGAGLLIRSFDRLLSQPLGFVPEQVISVTFGLPDKKYGDSNGEKPRFFSQLLEKARALPGVDSAAVVYGVPLGGQMSSLSVDIPGAPPPGPGEAVSAGYSQISPDYFRTLNIPVLQGRDFTEQDRFDTTPVLIVNEAFVRNLKLGKDVIGRRIGVGDGTQNAEIVGVVRDIKRFNITEAAQGEMYRPYRQRCWGYMSLVMRTKREPGELMRALRAEVDTLDKDLPFESPRTLTRLVASSVAQRRLSVQLLGGFAGVALILAAIGLYGVLAYNVAQRKREIGIRLALGARHTDVMQLVLRQGMTLALVGVAIGAAGAFGLSRFLGSLLFEIKPSDPATFAIVTAVLVVTAFFACWIPARRASRVDPMVALRND